MKKIILNIDDLQFDLISNYTRSFNISIDSFMEDAITTKINKDIVLDEIKLEDYPSSNLSLFSWDLKL